MAEKSKADLTTENNANVVSQTAPESITPTNLGGTVLQDIIDSMFNRVDGIDVNGMTIPAAFTSYITNGMLLPDILTVIMDRINALQIAVTGVIQGLIGEFLATTISIQQVIDLIGPFTTGVDSPVTKISFINDTDNGSFDNGNNWLTNKYVASQAHTNATFTVRNLILEVISVAGGLHAGDIYTFRIDICKNGNTGSPIASSSATASVNNGSTTPGTQFIVPEFASSSIPLAANDYVEVYLSINPSNGIIAGSAGVIKVVSGIVNMELI